MDPFLRAASALVPVLAEEEAPRDYPWALFTVGWAGGVAWLAWRTLRARS